MVYFFFNLIYLKIDCFYRWLVNINYNILISFKYIFICEVYGIVYKVQFGGKKKLNYFRKVDFESNQQISFKYKKWYWLLKEILIGYVVYFY